MTRILKLVALNVGVILVLLFVVDQSLGFFGYPADVTLKSTHRPNVTRQLKTIEFEYGFSTNSYGLRYPEIPQDKPDGTVRILMLGDSFTEGVGVEAEDTFGARLEEHYSAGSGREKQFVNGGLGGEGPVRFWRVFHDVGLKLDPDGLLLFIYANDMMDTPDPLSREELYGKLPERHGIDKFLHGLFPRVYMLMTEANRIVLRELRQSGGFVDTVAALAREQGISEEAIARWADGLPDELVEASDNNEFNKSLLSMGLFHPDYWSEAIDISSPRAQRKYEAMKLILDEFSAVTREHDIAMGLVYIPAPLQYDPSRHADWNPWVIGGVAFRTGWLTEQSLIQRRLADWARLEDIPFLDLTPLMREEVQRGGQLNFKLDGHWNADGHRAAGDAIRTWIDDNDVFPQLRASGGSNERPSEAPDESGIDIRRP